MPHVFFLLNRIIIPLNSYPVRKVKIVEADGNFLRSGSTVFPLIIHQSVAINFMSVSSGVTGVSMNPGGKSKINFIILTCRYGRIS